MPSYVGSATPFKNFSIPSPRPICLPQMFSAQSFPILTLFLTASILIIALCRRVSLSSLAIRALRHGSIPSHVAFIMDGNRRWARRLSLPDYQGHPEGGEKLIQSLQWCLEAGIRTVTVYAFSIENFKRSQEEVDHIMALAERKFHTLASRSAFLHTHRVRVRVLGDLTRIPDSLRQLMLRVVLDTACYVDGPVLNVCFAYTARYDIATAVTELVHEVVDNRLRPEDITKENIQACLSTDFVKGADNSSAELLVRTSGETRLSDFLLWESAQALLSFCPVLWPDLTAWDFVNILLDYQSFVHDQRRDIRVRVPNKRVVNGLNEIGQRYFDNIQRYSAAK